MATWFFAKKKIKKKIIAEPLFFFVAKFFCHLVEFFFF
jgi:hypothetical protein